MRYQCYSRLGRRHVTLLNEVNFMIEECGLRSGCRDYRNLTEVNSDQGVRNTVDSHCLTVKQKYLHF